MLQLGGEIADGVILTFVSPEMLKEKMSVIHDAASVAGRRPEDVKIVVRVAVAAYSCEAEQPFLLNVNT